MNKEIKIIIAIGVIVVIGGIFLFSRQPKPATPGQAVDSKSLMRDNSHMTGNKDAKVTVIEFGDYECPACAVAEPTVERLRTEYKDNTNVNFVFRNFPLPQHQKALTSAEAAESAGEQGKFWEMHDKLYQNQTQWVGGADHQAVYLQFAQEIGLDVTKFKASWEQNKFADVIQSDKSDGEALGVNSTPTFFINGEKASSYAYDELKSMIEEKLK